MSLKKGYGGSKYLDKRIRFSEIANTVHETLKYAINVNKNILKMKNIFSSKNGSRHKDIT